jgi:hypothetical protein
MNRSYLVDIASTQARKEEASCSTSSATSFCDFGVPIAPDVFVDNRRIQGARERRR